MRNQKTLWFATSIELIEFIGYPLSTLNLIRFVGCVSMTERVIRITQEVYQSLPALYQNIADIGKQSGRIIIIENQNSPKLHK